jgi:hypothetical protein
MKPERAINAYLELLNAPEILEQCPRCKTAPFHSFMRGIDLIGLASGRKYLQLYVNK